MVGRARRRVRPCSSTPDAATAGSLSDYELLAPPRVMDGVPAGTDPVPHILWLRRVAEAYSRPSAAVEHLEAVCRSVASRSASMVEGTVE